MTKLFDDTLQHLIVSNKLGIENKKVNTWCMHLVVDMCVRQLEITLQMRCYMFCSVDGVPIY